MLPPSGSSILAACGFVLWFDPYADPYGDSMGWTRQFGVDYDLRVFLEKGQKALQPQWKIPILAAHNPEVVGSSPASATRSSSRNGFRCDYFLF